MKKKKKGGTVWYIVAAVFAVSGLYAIANKAEGGFITLAAAAVLAFVGYTKTSAIKKEKQAALDKAAKEAEMRRAFNEKHGVVRCKVAGVTFDNDDGSSRQKLLRALATDPDESSFPVAVGPYTCKGKPAARIMYEDKCIGNVPAEYVEEVVSNIGGIEFANVYPDSFKNDDGKTIYRADLHIQYSK